ncbi:pyridoxine/pyridoxamine 5'-phosphate oxidase [Kitasatospora azatica]|uniref:pyridoxine/pyridoxamine 5'-phosphate oxidase n=1 Tax=Kitasatospora azatica TaxID=58347 RepID=UPI000B2A8195|nr:pyridoxal 5'-phosphate synthase [Kitasatospora azatica]
MTENQSGNENQNAGENASANELAQLRTLLIDRPPMARELPAFEVDEAPAGPGELFVQWLLGAFRAGVPDAQVMVLSTAGPDGRVLVLRDVDPAAGLWWFAGDADSPKGRQLAAEPRAALTFYWPQLGRQVRVRGTVQSGEAAAAAEQFRLLSPNSRTAALVGRQSEPLTGAEEFRTAWAQAAAELAREPRTVAEGYTRYAVRAEEVEFWQGAADRRHVRLVYRRSADGWQRGLVWP